jgi:putative peptidoglycan lipid II flippase
VLVAIGILCSRLTGLVRQRVFAHYFGLQSDSADAFTAAFRIPNLLQNLFGEGALSASFIPVYAALLARGERKEATRVAGRGGSAARFRDVDSGRAGSASDSAAPIRDRPRIYRRQA